MLTKEEYGDDKNMDGDHKALEGHNKTLKGWWKKRSSDLPFMPAPEKVKERRGNKNTTSKKLLIRLPVLLAQIGAGNNSYKPKKDLDKLCIYFINTIKSQKHFTTI